MPKLKSLSGSEIVKIFIGFGFELHNQKGSHIKLRRIAETQKQTLVIPNHKVVDKGTLKAIIRQSSKYISFEKLKEHFYSD
jgi:predicted RNA binding protein YcfA (HicA-like mRNA interferase family)